MIDQTHLHSQILSEAQAFMSDKWYTNLANLSALIYQHFLDINWAGFYLAHRERLYLGPFQGKAACLEIPFSRGVCGAAARERVPKIVPDVHLFPGHITCDPQSRSEIVVPLIFGDRLIGVLDVDSPLVQRFTVEDASFLHTLIHQALSSTNWPDHFG